MKGELIVVRKSGVRSAESLWLPIWVEQYNVVPSDLTDELVVEITPRFEQERWALRRGQNIFVLDLRCLATSGRRLLSDDDAEMTVRASKNQLAVLRVMISPKRS